MTRHINYPLYGHRHVLQLEPACGNKILSEYSSKVESNGEQPVTIQSLDLANLRSIREFYFSRRHCALNLILEMCRVARDDTLSWSSPSADCLADLFSSVEAVEDRCDLLRVCIIYYCADSVFICRGSTDIVEALLENLKLIGSWTYSNVQVRFIRIEV